jgi:hypothetical protein
MVHRPAECAEWGFWILDFEFRISDFGFSSQESQYADRQNRTARDDPERVIAISRGLSEATLPNPKSKIQNP